MNQLQPGVRICGKCPSTTELIPVGDPFLTTDLGFTVAAQVVHCDCCGADHTDIYEIGEHQYRIDSNIYKAKVTA